MRSALLAMVMLLGGCSVYHWGYEPVDPAGVVAVPIFENRTLRRGWEYSLTRYTRQRILDATPLQLAREGSGAPVLRGTIVSVTQGVVIPNSTDVDPPLESTVSITISVALVGADGRIVSGSPDGGPAFITESESWVPTFAQTVDSAADRVLRKLAERAVDLLEARWGGEPAEH